MTRHNTSRLAPVALGVAGALLWTACASSTTTAPPPSPVGTPTTATVPAAPAVCAWYTPTSVAGQIVSVTAQGPGCHDRSVIDRLTADSDRPWTTESYIPDSFGHLLGTLTNGRTKISFWFTGPLPSHNPASPAGSQSATPAAELAGRLATAFEAAGWKPVLPSEGTA